MTMTIKRHINLDDRSEALLEEVADRQEELR